MLTAEDIKNISENNQKMLELFGDDVCWVAQVHNTAALISEVWRLQDVIEKVRALHPAQFTRADVMKILKEGDS